METKAIFDCLEWRVKIEENIKYTALKQLHGIYFLWGGGGNPNYPAYLKLSLNSYVLYLAMVFWGQGIHFCCYFDHY